jgi:hypothetical protein
MVKRVLTSQKGASSVLVILLLLALVVFGVAALTTALSGLRLGQKVSDWNESYYRLEGQAARCWAEIDAAVSRAAETGGPFEQALKNELKQLSFETTLKVNAITYEVRSDGARLHVTLALDMKQSPRLRPTEWYQIQS